MHRKIIRAPHRLFTRFTALWRKRFGVMPLRESIADVTQWFTTPLGQALIETEQQAIDDAMQCLFGYHLLQLGISGQIDLTGSSLISHRFIIHPRAEANSRLGAIADFNRLPLPTETLDAVLLHHVLDFSQSPHHLLREATRVLIPRGHIIIVGFNPGSLWGLGSRLSRLFTSRARWRHQYLRLGRLLDWLKLLDVEPVEIYQGFYPPPLPQESAIKRLQWMERWGKRLHLPWGGFYLIVARKDHVALTPIKPTWYRYRPLRGLAVTRILGRVTPAHTTSGSPIKD